MPSHPAATVVPVPEAAKGPARPSPCDVAAALAGKAEALRAEGRLGRAARALGDALSRCPEKSAEIEAKQKAVEGERAAPSGESAAEIEKRAEALSAKGDVAGARRERERWLAARERESGAPAVLDLPVPEAPLDFGWSRDGALAAVLRNGILSVRDADLRAEKERYPVGAGADLFVWLHARRAVLVLSSEASTLRLVDLDDHRVGPPAKAYDGKVESLSVSPDDRLVAVWGDGGASIFDVAKNGVVGSFSGEVKALAFSPSASKVAVVAGGKAAVLDAPGFSSPVTIARQSQGEATGVVMTSESRVIVTGAGTVETFDAATGLPAGKPITNPDCEPWLLGPRSDKLVWSCYAYMEAESAPGKKRLMLATPTTEAHLYTSFDALAASPDGSRVWFSLWGQQGILDTKSGKRLAGADAPYGWLRVQFRPDNRRIAARNFYGTGLWTSDLGKDSRTVIGDESSGSVSALVVSADGKPLFADMDVPEAEDEVERMLSKAQFTLRPPGQDAALSRVIEDIAGPVSFSEGGARAGFPRGKSFDVIALPGGALVGSVPFKQGGEKGTLSPRGDACALVRYQELRVVDVATGKDIASWKGSMRQDDALRFSPDEKRLVAAGSQGTWLFEIGSTAPQKLSDSDARAAFAGNGKVVFAREKDIVVRDLASKDERVIPVSWKSDDVAASSDGRFAVAIGGQSALLVDLGAGTSVKLDLGGMSGASVTFLSGDRLATLFSAAQEKAIFYQTATGMRLGELVRLGPKAAYYRATTGSVELLGDAAKRSACVVAPAIEPSSVCEDRDVEQGLFARTLAGRGCTAEDVGDVCD